MGSDSDKSNANTGDGAAVGGVLQIPPSANEVVQNIKEIVNNRCTDSEIYAVLKDCNMEPNDAVQRLLSQDTFHEVKSKRERRKEAKETQELKNRANLRASNLSVRDDGEYWRSGSILRSTIELGNAAYNKENDWVDCIPKLRATGQTWNEETSPQSDSFNAGNRRQSIGTEDVIDSSVRPTYESQSSRVGATSEHVAMDDIVRMGRPKSKGSQLPCETSYSPQDAVPPNSTIYQMKPSIVTSDSKLGADLDLHSLDLNMTSETRKRYSQHGFDNEWDVNKPMTTSTDIGCTMYSNQPYLHSNGANLSNNCWSESDGAQKNISLNHVSPAQASNKQRFTSDSEGTSEYDDDLCKGTSSPVSYEQIYEPMQVIGRGSNASAPNPTAPLSDDAIKAAPSVAVNFQQLSLGTEDVAVTPKEDNHGVVLPSYLQALTANFSQLSFGTYKSGKNTALSQPQTSSSLTNDLEETLETLNRHSSSMHMNSRNLAHHDEEQHEFDFDRHKATADARSSGSPNLSQPELRKLDIPDAAALGNDYVSCESTPGSSFKNIQQAAYSSSSVIDPNDEDLSILLSEVHAYTSSVPSDLLAATIPSTKGRDAATFHASQTISSRYMGSASSIRNPIASMSQVPHGANPATGPVPYAYSYPRSGYQAIPQGHTYPPSPLHQTFLDGNVFRDSHSEMKYDLQPYTRASTSVSLPWSRSYTSGHRRVENPSNSPGNFPQNLLAGSAGSKVGYDDFLRPQYNSNRGANFNLLRYNSNRGANFNLLRQNEGSATWNHGHGSRTISTIPDNAYYSLHALNHQLAAGYQQGQQHFQQFHGTSGYPDIYNLQAAFAIEQQQQQNLQDYTLNASRGPSSRQLPQSRKHNR